MTDGENVIESDNIQLLPDQISSTELLSTVMVTKVSERISKYLSPVNSK